MTVETDLAKRVGELNLEKRVDEVAEKMEKKLSSDSMNGESFDKRVRQLRGPIVIGRAQHGIVKWFSVAKGYGFIRVDGSEKDCFVHASAILRTVNVPLALIENQQVEFDIIEGLKGPEAVCVSGPGGVRVGKTIGYMYKGTFYHTYPRFRQPPMLPVRYPAGQHRNNNTVEHKQNNNMGNKWMLVGRRMLTVKRLLKVKERRSFMMKRLLKEKRVPTRSVSIVATIVIQLQTNPRAPLIPPPRERMRRRRLSVRQRKMKGGKERRRSHQLLIRRPLLLLLRNEILF
uniref:CSD domain-containing protein n=1 Tax=Meloidogyne enterolobii TaxID=390850 RepID=A0A6V7W9F5_MELEN|nr:unnamed protein product [Meloidogyne enterolobii]